jgi:hypothetical protein
VLLACLLQLLEVIRQSSASVRFEFSRSASPSLAQRSLHASVTALVSLFKACQWQNRTNLPGPYPRSDDIVYYCIVWETRGEYEFWACWCSGNATGHTTGHVAGSGPVSCCLKVLRGVLLIGRSACRAFCSSRSCSWVLVPGVLVPGVLIPGVPCYWRFVLVPGRCASRSSWLLDF